MKRTFFSCLFAGFMAIGLAGCGKPEATNVAESMTDDELAEYDRMMEEDEALMSDEEMGDSDDG